MLNEHSFFRHSLQFIGRQVRVGLRSKNNEQEGEITNVMFDSLLLRTEDGNLVVRFDDIIFLTPTGERASSV